MKTLQYIKKIRFEHVFAVVMHLPGIFFWAYFMSSLDNKEPTSLGSVLFVAYVIAASFVWAIILVLLAIGIYSVYVKPFVSGMRTAS